ncbi:MAG: calmodulin-binding protein [Thermoguttaceae bacterium]|nr:calmodulin-binding protein [Thermoguttaceae bacterium]
MKLKILAVLFIAGLFCFSWTGDASAQDRGFSRGTLMRRYDAQDWSRFRYYPYVYYEQNFRPAEQYRSADDLYYRYPRYMQVPTYNPAWQNYYPVPRRFHEGKHFLLDVF